jgi:hypothetical protein
MTQNRGKIPLGPLYIRPSSLKLDVSKPRIVYLNLHHEASAEHVLFIGH